MKIHGSYIPVRAEVVQLGDFSVHADSDEILAWLRKLPREPDTVYVVHGEPPASKALVDRITDELGWCATAPHYQERVRLPRAHEPGAPT